MPYTNVKFIGYAVNTAPRSEYFDPGQEAPDPRDPSGLAMVDVFEEKKFYLGSSIPERDIKARVKIMSHAIRTAYTSGHCGGSDTLKIFMAPEFFFRGNLGAYRMDDAQTVITALREELKSSPYGDWVFIFGTTLGFSRSTGSSKEVYNFAIVQKGTCRIEDSRAVMKEFKSGIDFIGDQVRFQGDVWIRARKTIGLTDSSVEHLAPAGPSGTGKERQRWAFDGTGIFELDGITFGLEVCLDHAEQRLRNSPNEVGENMVQIQLIPSAGMEIVQKSVIAMKNGFVFNVDGSYGLKGKTPGSAHSMLAKVTKMHVGARDAQMDPIDPEHVISVTAVESFDNYFAKGPGEIHIYPAQRIPSPQKEQTSGR